MSDNRESLSQPDAFSRDKPTDAPKVVKTQELFDGQREICIEHDGEQYRLRITRRNKLILQK